jgi:hypothetical protein
MIIAYNLCFSTIMGKLKQGSGECDSETTGRLGASAYPEEMSAYSLFSSKSDEHKSTEAPYIAPNGSVFCPKSVRHGVLPLMLKEILETRLMVKRSMKLYKSAEDDILHRVLDARQLALKLIANVTYGACIYICFCVPVCVRACVADCTSIYVSWQLNPNVMCVMCIAVIALITQDTLRRATAGECPWPNWLTPLVSLREDELW